ncbi:MAG: hypothetical protein ACP6IY_12020 [Promethearchaeia archaeon]
MTTTIQIDDETKKKLFEIKLELERKKGRPVSYNELINFLIENQMIFNIKKVNMKDFRKFEGILPASAVELYYKEKKKDLEREERIAPLKK